MFLAACESRTGSDLSAGLSKESVQPPSDNVPLERRLIKDGSLEFKTDDWKKTKHQIRAHCDSLGAYSADESLSEMSDRVSYHQVIRVPTSRFDDLVDAVEKLSGKLENKNIKVNDVTREYIDLEVRIKNKKEMEDRYREMLRQAKTVDDMLKIERYITDVRTDVERMEAGLKSMQDRTALGTLELTYYEMVITDYGFYSRMVNALSNGWHNILVVIVALANIWPLLVITPVAIWLLRKWPRAVIR